MSTLNPDLISKDMDAVLNDAVPMLREYRKSSIMPEMILLAMLNHPNTPAYRMLKMFENTRGVDLEKLERQIKLGIQSRRDPDGSLDFVAVGNKKVPMINVLTQSVNRHIILVGPDGVGKRTLAYSLALLMAEDKGPAGLSNLVQISETALLDGDQEAFRAGMSEARHGILFLPLIHRFFGGPIKADFNKATSLVQKAFLSDDPVIICTTTDQEFQARIQGVSAIMENSQVIRVDEPSLDEAVRILEDRT